MLMPLHVEFRGGAELMFDNKKEHFVTLPSKEDGWNLGDVIMWLKDNLLRERPELFLQADSLRPGILVLINDTDWELLDDYKYKVQQNDRITFISTLHGG